MQIRGAVTEGEARNVMVMDWDQNVSLKGKTKALELHFLAVKQGISDEPIDQAPKHQTRWTGFDDKILSLYARGMKT